MKNPYTNNGFSIEIDLSRDELLTENAKEILKDRYLTEEEKSPQEAFARASCAFADDEEHAQRLYDYVSKLWFMFSTPVLSNGGTNRGMPISCFLNFVPDSLDGILSNYRENAFLTAYGGGVGTYFGEVRSIGSKVSRGGTSSGVVPFLKNVDTQMLAYSQGGTRRGSAATYLDISHPEIEEFIILRKPNGDTNRRCLSKGFHNAVNITDDFMMAVKNNLEWSLKDPSTGRVVKTISARKLWISILETRIQTGEPYLHFIDTSNEMLPRELKDKGLKIHGSNLCNEIFLPTNESRTAVCCLSSVNISEWDSWSKEPRFIEDLIKMLDNVLQFFIDNCPEEMNKARYSAIRERSLGLGAMGFHDFLQKKGVAFESATAQGWNIKIFKHLKAHSTIASLDLAEFKGEAPDMVGSGMRNAHLIALAPNASSSILCGTTSPSIEPFAANAFKQKTLTGSHLVKNKELDRVLKEEYGYSGVELEKVWQSIVTNRGSVQHLDFMDEHDKNVFKTFSEINQLWVIEHASNRQPFICQGQSVNLSMPSDVHKQFLHDVHFKAWEKGLKGLYYLRSESKRQAEVVSSKVERKVRNDAEQEVAPEAPVCLACEG